MSLVPFTGVASSAVLDANFDDKTSTLTAQAIAGRKDFNVFHRTSMNNLTALALRVQDFVVGDDFEVRCIRIRAIASTAGFTVTATLLAADGDADLLIGQSYVASVTSIVGTASATLDCRTTTQARRANLLRGGRYRLQLESSGATTIVVQGSLVLRARRRRR
jgi:hypothetical protein